MLDSKPDLFSTEISFLFHEVSLKFMCMNSAIQEGSSKSTFQNTFEPRCGKTGFLHMRKQRRRSRGYRKADQRLCFPYTDTNQAVQLQKMVSDLESREIVLSM